MIIRVVLSFVPDDLILSTTRLKLYSIRNPELSHLGINEEA